MRDRAVVEAEICHLETQIRRLERGELDAELFKKLRLQYGVYSIRGSTTSYMVRVRIPLGMIEPEQLEALAALCEDCTPSRSCHLTTRQDVQLYGIERVILPLFLRTLARAGLTTREASGNVVRNVACCPWAGVSPEEPFDITPYAQAVSRYLLRNPLSQLLPRKVKIAFEGCATDHARTVIHDIGVVAARQDGRRGFRIYAGGGLGPVPRAGKLIESWTSADFLLPTIEAILRVFEQCGERHNRARARLKFLVEQLGPEEFRLRVLETRTLVWATQSGYALTALEDDREPSFVSAPSDVPTSGRRDGEFNRWRATNVASQKQAAYRSVVIRVPLGDVTAAHLRGVAGIAEQYACGIRLTNAGRRGALRPAPSSCARPASS